MPTKKVCNTTTEFKVLNIDCIVKIIKEYTKTHTLLSSESSDDGKTIKLSYDIIMKEKYGSNELIKELSKFNYLKELVIVAGKSDIDY